MLNTHLLNTKNAITPPLVHRYPTSYIDFDSLTHLHLNSGRPSDICSGQNLYYFQNIWYILSIIGYYLCFIYFLHLIEIWTNLGVRMTLADIAPVSRLSPSPFFSLFGLQIAGAQINLIVEFSLYSGHIYG